MKRYLIILLALISIVPFTLVRAQEETNIQSTPTRQNIIRERLEQQRANYLQSLQEARTIAEEFRNGDEETRRGLRQKARQGFLVRLGNAIERLSDMQERAQTRIDSVEANGGDTAEAQALLDTSKEELGKVLDIQDEIKTLITETEEGTIDKEAVRAKFETLKTHLKNARMNLIDSLQALRQSVAGGETEEQEEVEVENNADATQE